MRTAAILPIKRFAAAKQRLGASVADALRLGLAQAMVCDVLLALSEASSIERTILVTSEPALASEARARGALLIEDAAEAGQSAAVSVGIRRALAEGMQRVLCIPGDCPALDPGELDSLLGLAPARRSGGAGGGVEPEVVIVPDRHGAGTNGLLLTPPDAIVPSFGPGSCERHRALARAAGVACRLEHPPSLLLDIDTADDLAALRERVIAASAPEHGRWPGPGALASRTRAVLEQPQRGDILSVSTSA